MRAGGGRQTVQRVRAEGGLPEREQVNRGEASRSLEPTARCAHPPALSPQRIAISLQTRLPLRASCFSDAQRMSGLITIYSVIIGLTATCSRGKPLHKGFALVFWKGKENIEQTNILSINGHFQLRTPAI